MDQLEQISVESLQISQELLSIHKINTAIVEKLGALTDRLAGLLSSQALKISKTESGVVTTTGFAKKLDKVDYKHLAALKVASPEGLTVDFVSYVRLLKRCQEITSMINENCLIPYAKFIAESLNRPELTESLTRSHQMKLHNLEQLRKDLGAVYKGTAQERRYDDCIKRNADWMDFESILQDLVLVESRMNKTLIVQKVSELSVSTQKLIQQLKDPNASHRPSTKLIDDLAKMVYGVAEQITFLSVVSTAINQMTAVAEVTKNQVLTFAKK